MNFQELVAVQDKKYERAPLVDARILCFDPGHTTGWAFFRGTELAEAGQLKTDDMQNGPKVLRDLIMEYKPTIIICEDYRVYKSHKDQHVNSEMLTTRVIGAIETIASFEFIPIYKNMAVVAKRFVTDAKLLEWGFYRKNERHARDAIRHGCYYIMFHHMHATKSPNNPHTTVG